MRLVSPDRVAQFTSHDPFVGVFINPVCSAVPFGFANEQRGHGLDCTCHHHLRLRGIRWAHTPDFYSWPPGFDLRCPHSSHLRQSESTTVAEWNLEMLLDSSQECVTSICGYRLTAHMLHFHRPTLPFVIVMLNTALGTGEIELKELSCSGLVLIIFIRLIRNTLRSHQQWVREPPNLSAARHFLSTPSQTAAAAFRHLRQ